LISSLRFDFTIDIPLTFRYTANMDKAFYTQEARKYEAELERLTNERDSLNVRIAKLKMDLGALYQLSDERPRRHAMAKRLARLSKQTLTVAIDEVFRTTDDPLNAAGVRERLEIMGYDGSRHSNLLASVHTTLKRLSKGSDSPLKMTLRNGKPVYQRRNP
jgi:hypothetical protein